jgi:rare lipoprotein A
MSLPRIVGMCLALVMASTGAEAHAAKAVRTHHPPHTRSTAATVRHHSAARHKRRHLARRATRRPRVARRSQSETYAAAGKSRHAAIGRAAWYDLRGRRTASGERFDAEAATAAHRTLPLDSRARVTNLQNGRSVVVKINDRGPFTPGRLIDLSVAAAAKLHMLAAGVARVLIEPLPANAAEIPGPQLAASPTARTREAALR